MTASLPSADSPRPIPTRQWFIENFAAVQDLLLKAGDDDIKVQVCTAALQSNIAGCVQYGYYDLAILHAGLESCDAPGAVNPLQVQSKLIDLVIKTTSVMETLLLAAKTCPHVVAIFGGLKARVAKIESDYLTQIHKCEASRPSQA